MDDILTNEKGDSFIESNLTSSQKAAYSLVKLGSSLVGRGSALIGILGKGEEKLLNTLDFIKSNYDMFDDAKSFGEAVKESKDAKK